MCYGMGCDHERRDTGTCAHPSTCPLKEKNMNSTNCYCPDCEAARHRQWLLADGDRYYCEACERWYTKDELRAAYTAEAESLEADAAFVRGMLAPLAA